MWIKKYDWVLMGLVLLLTMIGILMIYSADQVQTTGAGHAVHYKKQMVWLTLSLVACIAASAMNTRTLEAMSYWIYGICLLGLVIVLTSGRGVERWIQLPGTGFYIQPSELAKIATILALASYIVNRKKSIDSFKDLIVPFIIILLPAGLILLQPDLGTTIVFFFIASGILFWSGLRLVYLFLLISPVISFFLALVALIGEIRVPLWGIFFIILGGLIFYRRI
ncbi:MAG: FtsW/RodA/SpoVE family cell cycle protein, partial [Gemmatimonadota bacterium]|nr:FtsW/RodA/SpoVE family cell cycle protein [Gemmatimonadota bacterium]